jgi:hypothetical protein
MTESQAVQRVEKELQMQRARHLGEPLSRCPALSSWRSSERVLLSHEHTHNTAPPPPPPPPPPRSTHPLTERPCLPHPFAAVAGRTLRNVELGCIEPRMLEYGEEHALYYRAQISDTFGAHHREGVGAILAALEAGDSPWHDQAAHTLRSASPLALTLTLATLHAAENAACWTEALGVEAGVSAQAAGSADVQGGGAQALEKARRAMRRDLAMAAAAASEEDPEVEQLLGLDADEDALAEE